MALEIVWQDRAFDRFKSTIQYIEGEFGITAAKLFTRKVLYIIQSLTQFPELGSLQIKSKSLRGIVISKQNSLFYRVSDSQLIIVDFFDNRQSPDKKVL